MFSGSLCLWAVTLTRPSPPSGGREGLKPVGTGYFSSPGPLGPDSTLARYGLLSSVSLKAGPAGKRPLGQVAQRLRFRPACRNLEGGLPLLFAVAPWWRSWRPIARSREAPLLPGFSAHRVSTPGLPQSGWSSSRPAARLLRRLSLAGLRAGEAGRSVWTCAPVRPWERCVPCPPVCHRPEKTCCSSSVFGFLFAAETER